MRLSDRPPWINLIHIYEQLILRVSGLLFISIVIRCCCFVYLRIFFFFLSDN